MTILKSIELSNTKGSSEEFIEINGGNYNYSHYGSTIQETIEQHAMFFKHMNQLKLWPWSK